jgi:hypothetical protein
MSTGNDNRPAPPAAIDWRKVARATCLEVDWSRVAHSALGSAFLAGLVGGALHIIGKAIEAEICADAEAARRFVDEPPTDEYAWVADAVDSDAEEASATDASAADGEPPASDATRAPFVDDKTEQAAALLGVTATASEDEIRAALRSLLSGSRLHPDHGGDGEEAKRLIAAKNHLIDRARAVRR